MNLLSATSLKKTYKDYTAVRGVDFSLTSGKCIALIGPNGAGKTTILRILAGLLKPTEGKIRFSGQPANADLRKFIGYLPQYPVFPSWMTAKEFLIFSGELAYLSKKEAEERAEKLVEEVGIKDAWNKPIGGYSGGMKQRLGIAQAIIHSPKLLLLDEPVSSLDPIGRREVLTLLEKLKEEMTILFSTHILNDAEEVCDDLLLLHKGEIIEAGSILELRKKYQTSVIELEFQDNPEQYLEKLRALPSGTSSYLDRNTIKIPAADISKVRYEVLKAATEENWPLVEFHLNRASLEEMFMKAVKK
ncbi:ABC transporter ATP-binding protein [Oceanobacillus luteolus]|uniref:ATP-binding cassette domain-containing protein n=1 Tax=Oceanobacillus luteolus TaxID=1274358 RepID=A0ABW4HR30_9BACI|nr:ABC transporter ATP-binding protein [Oceanobacillus luteolus]MCM3739523.1 ABC transporter ATP-binding protein [Oceanobacillus luteolus]